MGDSEHFRTSHLVKQHSRDIKRTGAAEGARTASHALGGGELDLRLVLRTVAMLMVAASGVYWVAVKVFHVQLT